MTNDITRCSNCSGRRLRRLCGALSTRLGIGRWPAWFGGRNGKCAPGDLRITPIDENGWFL